MGEGRTSSVDIGAGMTADTLLAMLRKQVDPEKMLPHLSDDQLKTGIQVTAKMFKTLKEEAERRGIWDQISGRLIPAPGETLSDMGHKRKR